MFLPSVRASLFAAALLVCSAASADCVWPYWTKGPSIAGEATSVIAPDLNGDGLPDLVGAGVAKVFVALNADGIFPSAGTTVFEGTLSSDVIAAELTGDAHLDLAVAATAPSLALYVLPGNGNGTFGTPVATPLASAAARLATISINGDSRTDVALLTSTTSELRLLHGAASGTFTAGAVLSTLDHPGSLATADVDGDGFQDVVTGTFGGAYNELFFGNGDGTFDPVVRQPSTTGSAALEVRDMDADGRKDLVVLAGYNSVAVLRNLTGRTFGDPLHYFAPAVGMAVADTTGDSIPDVVLSSRNRSEFFVYTGSGTGTLREGGYWYDQDSYTFMTDVVAADFDDDGQVDIAMIGADFRVPSSLRIMYNLCGSSVIELTSPAVVTAGEPTDVGIVVTGPAEMPIWKTATGNVSIRQGDTIIGTATLDLASATVTIPSLAVGTHSFSVAYDGDDQHEPNTSEPFTIKAVAEKTTVTVTTAPQIAYGQRASITANVTSPLPGAFTGTLRFSIDGTNYPGYPPPTGSTYTAWPLLSVGSHTVKVYYSGDASHPPGQSALVPIVVTKATSRLILQPLSSVAAASLTLQVYVASNLADGATAPTGTVTLYRNDVQVGQKTTTGYRVEFPVSGLAAGRHLFRMVYSGDQNYTAAEELGTHIVLTTYGAVLEARGTASMIHVVQSNYNHVGRWQPGGPPQHIGYGSSFDDTAALPNTVYLYGPFSGGPPIDVAMRISFTDDSLKVGTRIRTVHMTEIVAAANKLRTAAGLGTLSISAGAGVKIKASDVLTLRNAINEARAALGAFPFLFTGTISVGDPVRALHIQELREAIR